MVAIVTGCQINNELVSHYVQPVLVKLDPTSRVSVCCDDVTLHAEWRDLHTFTHINTNTHLSPHRSDRSTPGLLSSTRLMQESEQTENIC
jgi:hypothetical protein